MEWDEQRGKEKRKGQTNPSVWCLDEQKLTQTNQTDFTCVQLPLCITQSEFRLTRHSSQTLHWLRLPIDWPSLSPIWKFHPPIPEQYPVQNAMRQWTVFHLLMVKYGRIFYEFCNIIQSLAQKRDEILENSKAVICRRKLSNSPKLYLVFSPRYVNTRTRHFPCAT